MDQTLSLYLLETIPLVDPQGPDYALVLLTLVESILEDPDIILRRQIGQGQKPENGGDEDGRDRIRQADRGA